MCRRAPVGVEEVKGLEFQKEDLGDATNSSIEAARAIHPPGGFVLPVCSLGTKLL